MKTFIKLVPDLLQTGRFKLLLLCSTADGWFVDFHLWDDEEDVWVEGSRLIPFHTEFVDDIDLLCELWCTPGLTEA